MKETSPSFLRMVVVEKLLHVGKEAMPMDANENTRTWMQDERVGRPTIKSCTVCKEDEPTWWWCE